MVSSFTQRERRDPSIWQREWRGVWVGGKLMHFFNLMNLVLEFGGDIGFRKGSFFLLSAHEGLPTGHFKTWINVFCQATDVN